MNALSGSEYQYKRWSIYSWIATTILVISALGTASAQTANSIDAVSVSKGSSGRTVVKFTLKAPLANPPAGFAITDPPRIALDFPDTANGLGRTAQDVGDPSLRSLNVVQAGGRGAGRSP